MGSSLLSYSSPTDAEPTGSVIVEARYGFLISTIWVFFILLICAVSVMCLVSVYVSSHVVMSLHPDVTNGIIYS